MRQFDEPVALTGADGCRLVISPMSEADIEPLASLYRRVWIRRDASRRVLDPAASRNFERTGGMFRIQDADSLARLLADSSELVWVAREERRPVGALWCGLTDEKYGDPSRILPYPGCEDLPERIAQGFADGTHYFSKEILVAPGARGRMLPEALLACAMRFFHARGCLRSYGEVYHVRAVRDDSGERAVGLFNGASYRMLSRTGCRLEGEFLPCVVHADGFDAVVSMRIVRWDLQSSLATTREALSAARLSMGEYA
ncbi:hypothetical protein ACH6CV_02950 [Bacillota bacterium Meth-B3]